MDKNIFHYLILIVGALSVIAGFTMLSDDTSNSFDDKFIGASSLLIGLVAIAVFFISSFTEDSKINKTKRNINAKE